MNESSQATSSISRVVSNSAVKNSTFIDERLLLFFLFLFPFNNFQQLFIFPRCKKDDENPIIKGTPRRYNEAECNLRRAYSDMFRITNPVTYEHISPGRSQVPRFFWIPMHVYCRLRVVPIFLRDSRASETRARVKSNHTRKTRRARRRVSPF